MSTWIFLTSVSLPHITYEFWCYHFLAISDSHPFAVVKDLGVGGGGEGGVEEDTPCFYWTYILFGISLCLVKQCVISHLPRNTFMDDLLHGEPNDF